MAITLDSSVAWGFDEDYDGIYTSGTFSPAAGTLVLVGGYGFDTTSVSITNSGTALTWTSLTASTWVGGSTANECIRWFYTVLDSSRSNMTVTLTAGGGSTLGFQAAGCVVYVLSGQAASSPVAEAEVGTMVSASLTIPTSGTSSGANSWSLVLGADAGANGSLASSDGTMDADGISGTKFIARKAIATSGASLGMNVSRGGTTGTIYYRSIEVKASSTTTHNADAAQTATATIAGSASKSTSGAAAHTTTATAAAAASREAVTGAVVAPTVTIAATMDVSNPASANAAQTATVTVTASATVERFANAALAATATAAAAGALERIIAAAFTVTASRTATATGGQVDTTPGTMRPISAATATMRAGTTTQLPRMAAVVGADSAMMTLLISTDATPSTQGIPVFFGGDMTPEAAGLVAAGVPYLWVSGGAVYYEDGS